MWLYIILVVCIFALVVGYIIILYKRNISLSNEVNSMHARAQELSQEEIPYHAPSLYDFRPPMMFTTSMPNVHSRGELIRQMQEWRTAGIVHTVDQNDSTILSLQRRLVLPGSDLGHEKDDTSTYNYRVVDKHGFVIELPRSYTQLVDDSIITQIPSMESKGAFKVDLSSTSYISVPMF